MYWSNWGPNAHIAMAGMDGKNRRLFVSKNIQWPKSMTIDYPNNRLYWFDVTLGIVESIRLDGTDRRVSVHFFLFAINLKHDRNLTIKKYIYYLIICRLYCTNLYINHFP